MCVFLQRFAHTFHICSFIVTPYINKNIWCDTSGLCGLAQSMSFHDNGWTFYCLQISTYPKSFLPGLFPLTPPIACMGPFDLRPMGKIVCALVICGLRVNYDYQNGPSEEKGSPPLTWSNTVHPKAVRDQTDRLYNLWESMNFIEGFIFSNSFCWLEFEVDGFSADL